MSAPSRRSNQSRKMHLCGADAAAFLKAVKASPEAAGKLVEALRRHNSIAGALPLSLVSIGRNGG